MYQLSLTLEEVRLLMTQGGSRAQYFREELVRNPSTPIDTLLQVIREDPSLALEALKVLKEKVPEPNFWAMLRGIAEDYSPNGPPWSDQGLFTGYLAEKQSLTSQEAWALWLAGRRNTHNAKHCIAHATDARLIGQVLSEFPHLREQGYERLIKLSTPIPELCDGLAKFSQASDVFARALINLGKGRLDSEAILLIAATKLNLLGEAEPLPYRQLSLPALAALLKEITDERLKPLLFELSKRLESGDVEVSFSKKCFAAIRTLSPESQKPFLHLQFYQEDAQEEVVAALLASEMNEIQLASVGEWLLKRLHLESCTALIRSYLEKVPSFIEQILRVKNVKVDQSAPQLPSLSWLYRNERVPDEVQFQLESWFLKNAALRSPHALRLLQQNPRHWETYRRRIEDYLQNGFTLAAIKSLAALLISTGATKELSPLFKTDYDRGLGPLYLALSVWSEDPEQRSLAEQFARRYLSSAPTDELVETLTVAPRPLLEAAIPHLQPEFLQRKAVQRLLKKHNLTTK